MQADPMDTHIYQEEIYNVRPSAAVILSQPWNEIPDEHKTLLGKILQAIRLSLDSVNIIHQETLNLSALPDKPSMVMAFAIPTAGVPTYEAIRTGGSVTVVADPLDVLLQDESAKRRLWTVLKSL